MRMPRSPSAAQPPKTAPDGRGRRHGRLRRYPDGTDTVARGVGFRYLIARRLGLYVGVDVAKSTQDHGIYLQVGSAWR
jgi:hypothetical protein